ncbi:MAG TPA: flagellar basal body rod protein FlgB [Hyphomicrobiaceae bacterium]|nr:flagellar basal body rod protein FlgB [Hyphomicrobiaceae bacterium]
MDPVNLFAVASQHSRWLSVRQSTIAQNIANANTPGYKAADVTPFESTLAATQLTMTQTRPAHMAPTGRGPSDPETREDESWETMHSGNNVSLEQQLMKAGEVGGAYALNTGLVKAFHRMLMASSKG